MKSSIIRHTTAIVALIIALFHSVTASAADTWSVNPSDYRYDMSLYLNVTFAAGEGLDYTQYDVAAFVGDECRGVAEVLPVPGGKDCLYLRARSNRESGETMTFRYRNKTTGEVKDIENVNFAFASNARLGYPSSPYEVKIVIYHDVIISTEGGGSVNESGGRLAEGTSLNLIATPDEGHYFSGWSDGSTENPRPLVVGTEDVALTATFALSQYHLTYTLDGETYKESERALHDRLLEARKLLPTIIPSDDILLKIASISIGVGVDGHRSDITMMHTARAHAAFHGRSQIIDDDIKVAARLTLKHRMRRLPFEEQGHDEDRIDTAVSAVIEG